MSNKSPSQPAISVTKDSGKKPRALWNDERDGFLITELIKIQHQSKRIDNSFKKEEWEDVTRKLNMKFQVIYGRDQIKSRLLLVSILINIV